MKEIKEKETNDYVLLKVITHLGIIHRVQFF